MSFTRNGSEEEDMTSPLPQPGSQLPPSTISRPHLRLRWKHLLPTFQIITLVLLLFLGAHTFVTSQKQTTPASPASSTHAKKASELTLQQISAMNRLSTVYIYAQNCAAAGSGAVAGSGVIIDPRGYIVTNYHVVANGATFSVALDDDTLGFYDGTVFRPVLPAHLVGIDQTDDLAVLKITTSKHLFPMSIGDSAQVQPGDESVVIGAPGQLPQTATFGHISATDRNFQYLIGSIQTDTPVNPGNSGGALINAQAQLIGIPTLTKVILTITALGQIGSNLAQGISFAIPSNRINFIVPQLIKYGHVIHNGHATIGAAYVSVDAALAVQDGLSINTGALLTNVLTEQARQAGLQRGDVIVQVDTVPINNASNLTDTLMMKDPGAVVTLGVMRGTQLMHLPITLQEFALKGYPTSQCGATHSASPLPGRG